MLNERRMAAVAAIDEEGMARFSISASFVTAIYCCSFD
jgi:hypothetical protein